ncbi:T9SS type A sorting domain-containing protein [uncultured Imperialibacter sp.]|uniref:T9SS type A sorting domain-containing protein n=1 Tax=uncultured Imperialibacter sp. TaxID=1672639 RepID=UPI0030DC16C4
MRVILFLLLFPLLAEAQLNNDFWNTIEPNLAGNTVFYSLQVNRRGDIYLGTNKGIVRSADEGRSWTSLDVDPVPFFHLIVSGDSIYGVSGSGTIYVSMNSGESWHRSQLQEVIGVTDMLLLANGVVLVATGYLEVENDVGYFRGNGLFKSQDNGHTWRKVELVRARDQYISHLAQDSQGRIYASLNEYTSADGALLYSTDHGDTWQALPDPLFDWGGEDGLGTTSIVQVTSLEVDRQDNIRISLQGASGRVATSLNLSSSFQGAVNGEEWSHQHLVPFGYPWLYLEAHNSYFAANGDSYAFRFGTSLTLSGVSYSKAGSDFEKKHINPLVIDGVAQFSYCVFAEGPTGRVYLIQQLDRTLYYTDESVKQPVLGVDKGTAIAIYPNPASHSARVRMAPPAIQGQINVFSSDGRLVYSSACAPGEEVEIPLTGVLPGIYFVTVATDRWKETHRLVVE